MANQPYTAALDLMAGDGIGWDGGEFLLLALDGDYTFDAGHATRQEIIDAPGVVIATVDLSDPTAYPAARLGADDVSSITPALGQTIRRLVVCTKTGSAATDVPLFYWDKNTDGSDIERDGDGTVAPIIWSSAFKMVKIG